MSNQGQSRGWDETSHNDLQQILNDHGKFTVNGDITKWAQIIALFRAKGYNRSKDACQCRVHAKGMKKIARDVQAQRVARGEPATLESELDSDSESESDDDGKPQGSNSAASQTRPAASNDATAGMAPRSGTGATVLEPIYDAGGNTIAYMRKNKDLGTLISIISVAEAQQKLDSGLRKLGDCQVYG
ncbi:uncharacterized protein BCR38DRAFT_404529 [Pseudomassariella vexata]|uniref:Myb-like domain-containing protein n=1 Tax=Pseudomassariella vexata TaxID=1141098 RepID=A0A1Y2EIQ5_9PEZI|nr:uncharacterized protein BCR38DRAFT_404529 [Pseudomassariella vexata]ORY71443.1 hypothetical protein BCR38DRAFT_404529 [Pseudomassariella vexata]